MLSITAAEPMWPAAQQHMSDELGASWDVLMRSLRTVTASAAP
jgi:hypothetical protein